MKVLIVSDTHRRHGNLETVLENVGKMDLLIHLGDAEGSERFISEWVNPECQMEMVLGNNDFFSGLPRELLLDIGCYKVWVTHGHNYYVSMGNETLKREAVARGVDIVFYGHTHRPVIDREENRIIAVNPGSLSYPRQEGRRPSYALMELDQKGEARFRIKYL